MEARWRRPRWRKDPLWVLLAWMLKIYCYLCFLFKNLQREINALKVEISAMKKTASEKRKQLLKETETHTQIKKDTEVRKASNLHPTPEQLIIIFPKCVQNYARLGAKTLFGACVFRSSTDALRPSSGACTSSWAGLRMHTGTDKELSTHNCAPPFYWNNDAKC